MRIPDHEVGLARSPGSVLLPGGLDYGGEPAEAGLDLLGYQLTDHSWSHWKARRTYCAAIGSQRLAKAFLSAVAWLSGPVAAWKPDPPQRASPRS